MRTTPPETPCYCRCGARFAARDCVGGRLPAHDALPSPFDVAGYKPGRCPDSGRVPVHVGAIV